MLRSVLDACKNAHSRSSSLVSGSVAEMSFSPNAVASSSVKPEWYSFTMRKPIARIIDTVILGILSSNDAVSSTLASVSVV